VMRPCVASERKLPIAEASDGLARLTLISGRVVSSMGILWQMADGGWLITVRLIETQNEPDVKSSQGDQATDSYPL
jgi:hypothetical protein